MRFDADRITLSIEIIMSKSIVEFTTRRITYDTSLPIAEVIARLETQINKAGAGSEVLRLLSTPGSRAEIEQGINSLVGESGLVYVAPLPV